MKENTHPFMVTMHSLEAKIEQLTREFRIRQTKDPVSSFWIMMILSRCSR
ncbi:hypothetical protein RM549_09215 [Salegentibacter sp. F188]|uniref:Ribosomal protein S15 n=1 Tax=Autumnicola patrickiae TaxID=3075591 RepID=A0ABU3E1V8_9FLAO|nr:hypothetical protein [Salegentibacter sp. F188]MDT0689962.1 hypothetical protein [Salegentibacter sp. F188]